MSVSLTDDAVRERRKTVTRRLGWTFLRPGDRLTLCRKVMGRRKGEPLVRLAEVEVVSVRREYLDTMDGEDIAREAVPIAQFADWYEGDEQPPTVGEWVTWYADRMGCSRNSVVTRIEWRYLA